MDKIYKIKKAVDEVNVELLFHKSHNAWTVGHLLKIKEKLEIQKKDKITYFFMWLVVNFCSLLPENAGCR